MKIISDTTEFKIEESSAVAIGKFDGIHRGHRLLMDEIRKAKKLGLKAAVFTFDPSPSEFFSGQIVKELMTKEEKRQKFAELEIDYLVEYPFNEVTAAVTPESYIKDYLINKMNARFIAAGKDISFGKEGRGNAELLKRITQQSGIQIRIIEKLCHNGREISSTYVREELQKGKMETVTELLGEPYFLAGRVEHGNHIGRTLGMPTVNLYPVEHKILPPNGVYFSTVTYQEQIFYGITNIGCKPTVENKGRISAETYIFDFADEIYEKEIRIHLYHFVRPEKKFANLEELKQAIEINVSEGKRYFGL